MEYKKLTLNDIDIFRPFFKLFKSRSCDYSIGGMFMWRDFYNMEFSLQDGTLFTRLYDKDGNLYYNLPMGNDVSDALKKLIDEELKTQGTVKFCTIPHDYLHYYSEYNCTQFLKQEGYSDYIYSVDDLINLKGRKYSSQRNLISQFLRNVDSWSFRSISSKNIDELIAFHEKHFLTHNINNLYADEENRKTKEVLENYDRYGFVGGYLVANDEIIGFSINEVIGDTFFTHIEKSILKHKGSYQVLTNQTLRAFAAESLIVNREEDMGDMGLRHAKMSYHPSGTIDKYIVEIIA